MKKIEMKSGQFRIRAFTLLESLIVLSLTLFLLQLFAGAFSKSLHIVRGQLFLLSFEAAYRATQQEAVLRQREQRFDFKGGKFQAAVRLVLPPEVKMEDFSIKFDEKGGNSSLKKLIVRLPHEKREVHYQLEIGSGKFKKKIY